MQALSKAKLKLFTSLQAKKYRHRHGMFVIEGLKVTQEALKSKIEPIAVVFQSEMLKHNESILDQVPESISLLAEPQDFQQLSQLQNPEGVLAILPFPHAGYGQSIELQTLPEGKGILLEAIQDPGNLGTLIRTADWFGLKHILCSEGTVDFMNPKVLRASMGSVFRVELQYVKNWEELIGQSTPRVWLADMEGEPAKSDLLDDQSWILLGNEAKGISPSTREIKNIKQLTLPRKGGAESLNVGIAGGILAFLLTSQG